MNNWTKHKNDIQITTCSRHDKTGRLQGYIIRIVADGYDETVFKHYYYRSVAELSALFDYQLKMEKTLDKGFVK